MELIASIIRKIASEDFWAQKIKDVYGISCHEKEPGTGLDPTILRQTFNILNIMPVRLVKDCKIYDMYFSNSMGPNRAYFPNHGYYINNSITMNNDIYYHPDIMDDFFDENGHFISRPCQTLLHEFGHSLDSTFGDLSLKSDWLKLSGWSQTPQKGLKRLIINAPDIAPIIGEWFYNPKAGFTRFYAKRNCWDDWADSFSFYVYGMESKLPQNKNEYFDNLLKHYY